MCNLYDLADDIIEAYELGDPETLKDTFEIYLHKIEKDFLESLGTLRQRFCRVPKVTITLRDHNRTYPDGVSKCLVVTKHAGRVIARTGSGTLIEGRLGQKRARIGHVEISTDNFELWSLSAWI